MRTKPVRRFTSAAALALFAALVTGCGSSGSNATPVSGGSTRTTVQSHVAGVHSSNTTVPPSVPTDNGPRKPDRAALATVEQELNDAGSSISATQSAVSGSDVNTARQQEGNAP